VILFCHRAHHVGIFVVRWLCLRRLILHWVWMRFLVDLRSCRRRWLLWDLADG